MITDPSNPTQVLLESGALLKNIHSDRLCVGRGCSIHHPSPHHMRDWPMVWRDDKGFFERTCEHGVGHPDFDDVTYMRSRNEDWAAVHGCDGCCREDPH